MKTEIERSRKNQNVVKSLFDIYGLNRLNDFVSPFYFFDNYDKMSNSMDIVEKEDEYVVEVDMPGVNKDEIEINIDNGILTVSGQRSSNKETNGEYVLKERSFSSFKRSVSIGNSVDIDHVSAQYKDGVLNLIIPKKNTKTNTKRIEIK